MGLEGGFLEEVGAVPRADALRKREVQLNTRMHYTQRRCAALPGPGSVPRLPGRHSRAPRRMRALQAEPFAASGACAAMSSSG